MVGLIARAGLAFGVLLTLAAGLLVLSVPAGTPESAISGLTVGMGVFLILICTTVLYIQSPYFGRKRR